MKEDLISKFIISKYFFIALCVLFLISTCTLVISLNKLGNIIEEKGLKSVLEEVWEGKK